VLAFAQAAAVLNAADERLMRTYIKVSLQTGRRSSERPIPIPSVPVSCGDNSSCIWGMSLGAAAGAGRYRRGRSGCDPEAEKKVMAISMADVRELIVQLVDTPGKGGKR
jgi:hypothetical protein